ncbi:MAG: succinylglutamate desuccinylase/aspartoacylase family protein [bacterium]|nr:succinylglutamate desuccinylase/aspartoacylase family protein [bacterium]
MDFVKSKLSIPNPDEPIFLDCLSFGGGAPKTLLISGIHGNEKSGQIIIGELMQKLPTFIGTLTILPIANPTGFLANSRQESTSGLDLNRHFFDAVDEGLAHGIIRKIISIAKQHDCVIDLHNFTTAGLIQVVSNHVGRADQVATLFDPDVVRSSPAEHKNRKTGTLAQYLKESRIPYILLEVPVEHKVSREQIDRIVSGLIAYLQGRENKNNFKAIEFDEIPHVVINLIKSEKTGEFIKNKQLALGKKILKGDVVGEMISDRTRNFVRSNFTGLVCEMDNDEIRIVRIGDTLIGIGESK